MTDELTIEAWVTPSNLQQGGPARIVASSLDQQQANFMLGQQGERFVARIRSAGGSLQGAPFLFPEHAHAETRLHHLVATQQADGLRVLYVDGRRYHFNRVDGDLGNWDPSFRLHLANERAEDGVLGRAWLGTFHRIDLYCRALRPLEVARNFTAGLVR